MELMLIIAPIVLLAPVLALWLDDERDHLRQIR
jgi:hypothetical protein